MAGIFQTLSTGSATMRMGSAACMSIAPGGGHKKLDFPEAIISIRGAFTSPFMVFPGASRLNGKGGNTI